MPIHFTTMSPFRNLGPLWVIMPLLLLVTGCGIKPEVQTAPNTLSSRSLSNGDRSESSHIQLFFDGTANKWNTRTNVRRLFERCAAAEDPKYPCLYVDGVGNNSLSGMIFAVGLKPRVLEGYKFLARNWSGPKDEIRIYGFSRGAFEARVLAGLVAHCGLPDGRAMSDRDLDRLANQVWKESERLVDAMPGTCAPEWESKLQANRDTLAAKLSRDGFPTPFSNRVPTIHFMGLWDTVPGLQFAKIKDDITMTDQKKTQRYKIRPYSNIKVICHALALDEHRKQFAPLLVGDALDSTKTKVTEVWFPGAHADIGGGYPDSNDLAGEPMTWMIQNMRENGIGYLNFKPYRDPTAVQHHPENVSPNNVGGIKYRVLPEGSFIHRSVFIRVNHGPVKNGNSGKEKPESMKYECYRPRIGVYPGGEENQVQFKPLRNRSDWSPFLKRNRLRLYTTLQSTESGRTHTDENMLFQLPVELPDSNAPASTHP